MTIQGISGWNMQVRTFQPGTTLNQIKEATQNNDLQEVVIKNEKGYHVIYSPSLKVQSTYTESDGLIRSTNLKADGGIVRMGEKVNFGDLKGQLVYSDFESKRETYQKGIKIGAAVGLAVGAAAGIGLFYATGGHCLHSSFPVIEAIYQAPVLSEVLYGFMAGAPGFVVGSFVGGGITHMNHPVKPDDSKLKQILQSPPILPKAND